MFWCRGGVLISRDDWIQKAKKCHGDFYSYSKVDFQGVKKRVLITCPIHGDFWQIAEKHFEYGCRDCAGNKPLTSDIFIERARRLHDDKYDYCLVTKVSGKDTKVSIVCPKHGLFKQLVNNHLQGKGCKYCSAGNSSKKEQKWLDDCRVPNDSAHRNVLVHIGGRKFCVDGIFQREQLIYEFLGDFWHGHPKKFDPRARNRINKKQFSELFEYTVDRIRWFRLHGYKVICVWESNFDKRK
jgi:hypothetical protein